MRDFAPCCINQIVLEKLIEVLVGTVDFVQQVDHVCRLFSRLVETFGGGEVAVTAILLCMVGGFFQISLSLAFLNH